MMLRRVPKPFCGESERKQISTKSLKRRVQVEKQEEEEGEGAIGRRGQPWTAVGMACAGPYRHAASHSMLN